MRHKRLDVKVWLWLSSMLLALPVFAQEAARVTSLETLQSRSVVVLITVLAVVVSVVLHYEALNWLTGNLKKVQLKPRRHILMLIFAILFIHVMEIWIFGVGYFYLISGEGHGALVASHVVGFLDCVYYSAVCFTTLGLGDVVPIGAVRFVTGTEALTGFVLLTWSASFTFVEMERFWRA